MRIGIVHRAADIAERLRRAVTASPSRDEVLWIAASGPEAVSLGRASAPDLVLMDLSTVWATVRETTRQLTSDARCVVLVVTDSVQADAARVFEAMGHGALDAVDLPAESPHDADDAGPMLAKITTISRLLGNGHQCGDPGTQERPLVVAPDQRALVAIGASAGGPGALAEILTALPPDFPAGVVIVQHVDGHFVSGMAEWLGRHTRLPVRVAVDGDDVVPGTVLLAGTEDHLVVTASGNLRYAAEPTETVYRPSIDVFFDSVSTHWRGRRVGVLLTGMGRDGAMGLKGLREAGAFTIAQDEMSSVVYGMPKAALAVGAVCEVLPLQQIGIRVVEAVSRRA